MFDFDIKSIISVQPKPKSKLNVFSGLRGYSQQSSLIVDNKTIKRESKTKEGSTSVSLLEEALANSALQHERSPGTGITLLKPELIAAIDFLPLYKKNSPTDVMKFLEYSFLFRQYKEQQINDILRMIEALNTPEADDIKNSLITFKNDMELVINSLSSIVNALSEPVNTIHEIRGILAQFKNYASMPEGSEQYRVYNSLFGGAQDIFGDYQNDGILNRIIAEIRRNILYPGALLGGNYVDILTLFDTTGRTIEYFYAFGDNLNSLTRGSILSPYHIFFATNNAIKSTIDTIVVANRDNQRLRRNLFTFVNEISLSSALYDQSQFGNPDADIIRQRQSAWRTKISNLGESRAHRNNLIQTEVDIRNDDGLVRMTLLPLSFILPNNEMLIFNPITYESYVSKLLVDGKLDGAQDLKKVNNYFNENFPEISIAHQGGTFEAFLSDHISNRSSALNTTARIGSRWQPAWLIDKIDSEVVTNILSLRVPGINEALDSLEADNNANPVPGFSLIRALRNKLEESRGLYRTIVQQRYGQVSLLSLISINAVNNSNYLESFTKYLTMLIFVENEPFMNQTFRIFETLNNELLEDMKWVTTDENGNRAADIATLKDWNKKIAIKGMVTALFDYFNVNRGINRDRIDKVIEMLLADGPEPTINDANVSYLLQGNDEPYFQTTFNTWISNLFRIILFRDNSFVKNINNFFNTFIDNETVFRNDENESHKFSSRRTHYSNIDHPTMLILLFEIIRQIIDSSAIMPIVGRQASKINFELTITDEFLEMLIHEKLFIRPTTRKKIQPVIDQVNVRSYNDHRNFIKKIAKAIVPGPETHPLLTQETLEQIEVAGNKMFERFNVEIFSDIFDKRNSNTLFDQLDTVRNILERYKLLNNSRAVNLQNAQTDILDLDDYISSADKKLVINEFKTGKAMVISEEIDLSRSILPRSIRADADPDSNKLLIIGIPVGFRNKLNKLFYEQKNRFLSTVDLRFSRVLVDVYTRPVSFNNEFELLKRAKFDIDYFTRTNTSIQHTNSFKNLVLYDKYNVGGQSSFLAGGELVDGQFIQGNLSDGEMTRRRNEAMSYLLKKYIQILFGINLDESQFFANRDIVSMDNSDSESDAFIRRFQSLVNNLVNEKLKIDSFDQRKLTQDIKFLIATTPGTSVLRQFSNDIIESTKRAQIDKRITPQDKEIKIELEDMALNVASMFRYADSISGGVGFFKRAMASRLFEKVIVIDVPALKDDINDYYVKVSIDKQDRL